MRVGLVPVSAVQFKRATKRRGVKVVFSDLDLTLAEGEFLGLAGVNGAGKTSLMKCLLDLDTLTSGEITLFGRQHGQVAARQHLAYLPEKFRPPGYLSGWEFLHFMSQLHGNTFNPEQIRTVVKILDLEITELDKLTVRLSKGTAHKLGLAGCMMGGKRLLVMDEPMSGLDPVARMSLQSHLQELKRQGVTCLFTTHLPAEVERLCDRIAILHQGELRYAGSPADCNRYFNAVNLEQAYLRCVGSRGEKTGAA